MELRRDPEVFRSSQCRATGAAQYCAARRSTVRSVSVAQRKRTEVDNI